MGLALAYNLAAAGAKRIVVVDANYLAWGASGRNGGGVRQQWSTEMNIRLMQESLSICAGFAQELGINVWLRQGGYLFLARTEATRARLEASIALQNRCDVPTRLIDMNEARQLVPEPSRSATPAPAMRLVCRRVLQPHRRDRLSLAVLVGLRARRAETRRRDPHRDPCERDRAARERRLRPATSKGPLVAARVVNAAGAWSPAVARLAGIDLPDWPERHEILSTEPLKPFLRPMVSVLESGLYVACCAARSWEASPCPARDREVRLVVAAAVPAIDGDQDGRDHAAPRRRQGRAPVGRPLRHEPRRRSDRRRSAGHTGLLRLLRLRRATAS